MSDPPDPWAERGWVNACCIKPPRKTYRRDEERHGDLGDRDPGACPTMPSDREPTPAGDAQRTGARGGQTCQAWYQDPRPGYENVGVCALPL